MTERCVLRIRDLSLQVHLGCTLAEQEQLQEVRVSVDIRFPEPPVSCRTDRLEDTICYAKISEALRAYSRTGAFWTVEKLAQGCFEILKEEARSAEALRVCVHKVKPPIDTLLGGVFFEIEAGPWH